MIDDREATGGLAARSTIGCTGQWAEIGGRGTVKRRSAAAVLAMTMTVMLLGAALPATVLAMPNCNGSLEDPIFETANRRVASGQTGVYALTEVFNPQLCVLGPADDRGTRSYVALRGGAAETFAVGYIECGNTPFCGPLNGGLPYYFYTYSRNGGACGSVFSTGIVKAPKGNVGSTPTFHDFEVSRAANGNYYAYIDEVSQYGRQGSTITCWSGGAGVQSVRWQGETLDPNDQVGGTVSNHAQFKDVQYKTSSGWHAVSRALASPCDFNGNPSFHKCGWGSTSGTFFNLWDTRAP